ERAETTLEDGTKLAVELSGARATRAAAAAGLAGAPAAIDRKAPVSPDSASAQGDTGDLGLVGRSAPMQELFHMMDRIKGSEATILVTGENGTGKELVAKAIHAASPRAARRFVATNCSAFNDNLLESELFGHRKGSFTGAVSEKL